MQKNMSINEFLADLQNYSEKNSDADFVFHDDDIFPCLTEKYRENGGDTLYFSAPIWIANKIYQNGPQVHIDVGSRFETLIANLLSFHQNIIHVSKIPLPYNVRHMQNLEVVFDINLIEGFHQVKSSLRKSISAMNVFDHMGLGCFGEQLNPDAWLELLESVKESLADGEHFYLSTRLGTEEKIFYNRYRIFKPETIIEVLKPLKLVDFSLAQGRRSIHIGSEDEVVNLNELHRLLAENQALDGLHSRIGMFDFVKGEGGEAYVQ